MMAIFYQMPFLLLSYILLFTDELIKQFSLVIVDKLLSGYFKFCLKYLNRL